MTYSIENEFLKADIKSRGAELCGLTDRASGINYIWNGDPAFWGKHSPVLFPIVGTLKNDTYYYEGKVFKLGRHGFAREMEFSVLKQEGHSIAFLLESNDATSRYYPFAFRFKITYSLHEKELRVTYHVSNPSGQSLLFSVGGHPAFAVPFVPGTSYGDYYLEFEFPETAGRWPISAKGLIEDSPVPLLNNSQKISLSKTLFYKDALVFKQLRSQQVTLKTAKGAGGLEMSYPGFPYLGIWAAKDADFVCIEPWCGIADSVNTNQQLADKEGINMLSPGGTFERTWSVKLVGDF
ncbi:MAG: aldose 1-epimerase family protein [Chitinophagaceae bacterium]|nr:aldose 1-epimerase family protein [Chitinophagaceae bacterium]